MARQEWLMSLKVGDVVTRLLAGEIPVKITITSVDDEFIHANPFGPNEEGWKFRRSNGAEVDEELGWDGITMTGSYLILPH